MLRVDNVLEWNDEQIIEIDKDIKYLSQATRIIDRMVHNDELREEIRNARIIFHECSNRTRSISEFNHALVEHWENTKVCRCRYVMVIIVR